CGGFPCQDISTAGKGIGITGPRSGLWFEYARIVRELRPRVVVVENVSALISRGLDRVLGELSSCGYDAVWFPLRAADVGAPHRRERFFIVAYTDGMREQQSTVREWQWWDGSRDCGEAMVYNDRVVSCTTPEERAVERKRSSVASDGDGGVARAYAAEERCASEPGMG